MPGIARRKSVDYSSDSSSSITYTRNARRHNLTLSETGSRQGRGSVEVAPTNTVVTGINDEGSTILCSHSHSHSHDEMQQVLHLPPAYSAAQSTYPQPSSYPTGSGNRILFPRAPGVRDPLVGFGSPVAEDWGREPIYVGTAFHPNGTQHPAKVALRPNRTVECQYAYGGAEQVTRNFDVLIFDPNWMEWVDSRAVAERLQSRIIGGQEGPRFLFHTLARVTLSDDNRDLYIPGKTADDFPQNTCNFGFGGSECEVRNGKVCGNQAFRPDGSFKILCWRARPLTPIP